VLTLILGSAPCLAIDPHSPEVIQAIDRGLHYFREHVNEAQSWEAPIVSYALIRGGEPVDSPAVKTLLKLVLDTKFHGGTYNKETPHQFYEAGTEMMMLEAINPRRYQRELEVIAAFTTENQWPSGSWYYYRSPENGGDTSHTQYAILGLWAASRAGVRIPRSVWSRCAEWHLKNQLDDGGFAYHPGGLRNATHSMTVNGVASLCIARLMLYPNRSYPSALAPVNKDDDKEPAAVDDQTTKTTTGDEPKAAEPKPVKRPDVLQPLDLSSNRTVGRPRRGRVVSSAPAAKIVSLKSLNRGIARGTSWVQTNFTKPQNYFHTYYLYGLERMCALAGVDNFDGHDWYSEHAAALLGKQLSDGRFDGEGGSFAVTAFAMLFLSKATSQLVGPQVPRFGGGLMIGGRGLPSNLGAVLTTGDGIKVRKIDAPVDKLLSELENPKSVEVEAVQQAIVDTVQVGDREKLVGQKDRLKKLARDPRPEVRRTALWALGRCATVHDALVLVKALDDPDVNVVVEANAALCWLSRRPNGFGHSIDPLAEVPENASDLQRRDALETWRKQARRDWREWFSQVGPYSERELPIDLPDTPAAKVSRPQVTRPK
jgi:hypothetical protein